MLESIDEIDGKILNLVQEDFPLHPRPFQQLSQKLNIPSQEILNRVQALQRKGIIRKIGPTIESRELGYYSTLIAMKVPEERLEQVARIVSNIPQVTHNYHRDHVYNLWFTIHTPTEEDARNILNLLQLETGITEIHNLPAQRVFKIRVKFDF